MSKLPNAPLIEVIFELRWKVSKKSDLTKYQYLIGDLYSAIKDEYPFREILAPPALPPDLLINNPVHRYREAENQYPLVQVGPGVLTLNTVDDKYYWEEFYDRATRLTNSFFQVYPVEEESFKPTLQYLDFFEFNFRSADVNDYVNQVFNISVDQSFISNPHNPFNLDIGFFYEIELGKLEVTLKRGKNTAQKDGIVMRTAIQGDDTWSATDGILTWLDSAHSTASEVFKKITEGELYKSFK